MQNVMIQHRSGLEGEEEGEEASGEGGGGLAEEEVVGEQELVGLGGECPSEEEPGDEDPKDGVRSFLKSESTELKAA